MNPVGICLIAAIVASIMTIATFLETILDDCEDIRVKLAAGGTIWLLSYLVFAGLFVTISWLTHLIK